MSAKTTKRVTEPNLSPDLSTAKLAFAEWCAAAEDWHRLRSDAAEARCRKARTAFYTHVFGAVPPIQNDWRALGKAAAEGVAP